VILTAVPLYFLLFRAYHRRRRSIVRAREFGERFELAARAASDAIWDWNLRTNEMWWSDGFENLFGFAKEELEPTVESWTRRLHPEDKERSVAGIYRVINSGGRVWSDEYRFRRKDGSYAIVHDRGFVIHDAGGKPIRMVGGMTDVTARKEAEAQLDQSRRQMRALSARLESLREEERTRISREIHDELGQLLTGLKMDLRWVERKLTDSASPELNPIIDRVVAATEVADQTIESVQKIAAELRPGVLDNFGLATAIKYESQRFSERSGIASSAHLPEDKPEIDPGVATAVFRIFQETLTNVARHADATEVEINLRQEHDELVLQVQDNGQGISPEALANPRSLGLAGMKERAVQVNGTITFARGEKGGTVVTLRVPQSAHDTKFWEMI